MTGIDSAILAPGLEIPRIINGMWQVSGSHGIIDSEKAISEMFQYHDAGLTAWDMADIYGPAESFFGEFQKRKEKKYFENSVGLTKFVPNPGPMTRSIVEHYVDESRKKMNLEIVDLIQFHWWDYNDSSYLDALKHLETLRDDLKKIRYVGLTNFDTNRMQIMVDNKMKIVSNQVQYSILDQRPQVKMTEFCQKHGITLLCYGTLLGGFLSEKYLNTPEPTRMELTTSSLQKYKNMIDFWGGWNLFQELLSVLDEIAQKHNASISNVSTRYVLDKPAVSAAIIGTRLGISEHIKDNLKTFEVSLDDSDYSKINSVLDKSNNLFQSIGDCGDEYR